MYNSLSCQFIYKNKRPTILVLDSGVGGLFIYEIVQKILPSAYYLYFFDNKFFPYGELSEIFITQRVISIIETVYNLNKLDLIIIACNTISVVSLKILKFCFNKKCPIIGVIPEIQLASRYTKNGIIGVLATNRTISHNYTLNLIKCFASQHKVMLLGTSKLVKLAEAKICGKQIPKLELQNIFTPWLELKKFPDTIVLGCTHFSLLRKELEEFLPKNSSLIDSRRYFDKNIRHYLNKYFQIDNICNYKECNKNVAYYTMHTPEITALRSVFLLQYNFYSLEMILI